MTAPSEVLLSRADWVILITYLLAVAAIGLIASRRVKDTSHFFLGSRGFNKWIMIAQSFGNGTHADMPVSLAGAVYVDGVPGIWYQWKNLFATPFYWMIAPFFRRARRTTTAEILEDRYGSWMGTVYTGFALAFFVIRMAGMLKGAGKVIGQALGAAIPVNAIVVAMTLVFVLYSFVGGLVATAWTEVLQGMLIIVLSFLVIPMGWSLIGGLEGLRSTLGDNRVSLVAAEGIGPWFVFVLTINGLIGIVAQPHIAATVGTGRSEQACREGMLYGNTVKRFCTIGWALIGLLTAALVAKGTFGVTHLQDPEDTFGFACRHLLFPGGVGLLLASLLATNMAGCSAFMVDSGALFTRSFYQKFLVRGRSDRHYLWVGRISGVAIVATSALYAVFFIDRVLNTFLLTETMATYVGVTIFGGVMWPRATRWGALAAIVVAMATNFAVYSMRGERLDQWQPDAF